METNETRISTVESKTDSLLTTDTNSENSKKQAIPDWDDSERELGEAIVSQLGNASKMSIQDQLTCTRSVVSRIETFISLHPNSSNQPLLKSFIVRGNGTIEYLKERQTFQLLTFN